MLSNARVGSQQVLEVQIAANHAAKMRAVAEDGLAARRGVEQAGNVEGNQAWQQLVRGDVVSGSLTELPCDLLSGYLVLNGQHSGNRIPIPLSCDGDVELHLTSAFAESVRVRGNRVSLELLGEPEYVEQLPGADRA